MQRGQFAFGQRKQQIQLKIKQQMYRCQCSQLSALIVDSGTQEYFCRISSFSRYNVYSECSAMKIAKCSVVAAKSLERLRISERSVATFVYSVRVGPRAAACVYGCRNVCEPRAFPLWRTCTAAPSALNGTRDGSPWQRRHVCECLPYVAFGWVR